MTFIDSNIPMYVVGADHPNKERALAALERLIVAGERLVTDAEVFQEILHRYVAIHRLDAIGPAFDALARIVDEVFDVTYADTLSARDLLSGSERLSARDAIHVAIMRREGVSEMLSFDSGFDAVTGIHRVS